MTKGETAAMTFSTTAGMTLSYLSNLFVNVLARGAVRTFVDREDPPFREEYTRSGAREVEGNIPDATPGIYYNRKISLTLMQS